MVGYFEKNAAAKAVAVVVGGAAAAAVEVVIVAAVDIVVDVVAAAWGVGAGRPSVDTPAIPTGAKIAPSRKTAWTAHGPARPVCLRAPSG